MRSRAALFLDRPRNESERKHLGRLAGGVLFPLYDSILTFVGLQILAGKLLSGLHQLFIPQRPRMLVQSGFKVESLK